MDDQLDNDLKNRIKEAFENFDDVSADEGWLQLRKKFPEEKPDRRVFAWIWWGAAAAILLLFLGIGTWVYNEHAEPKKFSYRSSKSNRAEKIAVQGGHNKPIYKIAPAGAGRLADNTSKVKFRAKPNQLKSLFKASNYAKPVVVSKLLTPGIFPKKEFMAKILTDTAKALIKNAPGQLTTFNSIKGNTILDAGPPKSAIAANADTVNAISRPPARSMASVFAEEKNAKATRTVEKTKNDTKRVHFGIYAATYFNYAKGSSNQLNAGVGFSSDIAISKNIKLESGVAIAQNTLNYNSAVPTAAAVAQDSYYAALVKNPLIGNYTAGGQSNNVIAAPLFKNYNASLVGLDIPLNIKYEFNPQKGNTYIVAGVSSGTFINEAYTYQYNFPSFYAPAVKQTESQTTTKSFNSFYFAKTLNVAFGVGYPLGKNHLIIEPFLKYPLEGLGAQQLRFGAGGLNLKFNFSSKK